ncbi:MAG TPA: hypothetical protein VHX68_06025, partial [Planctomycetaceae bacterium]|nr:hypothetical protein [Planctomycetaceae bacterium]
MKILRTLSRWLFGLLFMVAGVLHFVAPAFYLKIMPPLHPVSSRDRVSQRSVLDRPGGDASGS